VLKDCRANALKDILAVSKRGNKPGTWFSEADAEEIIWRCEPAQKESLTVEELGLGNLSRRAD